MEETMNSFVDPLRAEKMAQDRMLKGGDDWEKRFTLAGPFGFKDCEWLDPYLGLFIPKGADGFLSISDLSEEYGIQLWDDE